MMFIIHIWQYWWTEKNAYPSLRTVASKMNISWRQSQRYTASLREKGFLIVTPRVSPTYGQTSNEYDFSPLTQAVLAAGSPPTTSMSWGGTTSMSWVPTTPTSSKEDEDEEDPERRTSKVRKRPTPDGSAGTAPATNLNGAIAPAAAAQKPLRARLPAAERRRYDEERRRVVDYLADFARELGDGAPLASSVTRAVNLMHRAGVDLEAFVQALYHARAVTKERWAAVRKEERDPGRPFPRKQAMAYFFAELEHALGLRALPETPAEHAARKEAERQERQRDRDRHPDWARATGTREWVQTYTPGEGLPAFGADGGEDDGA
jgi:hypothetical protein